MQTRTACEPGASGGQYPSKANLYPEVEKAAVKVMRALCIPLCIPRELNAHAIQAVVQVSEVFHNEAQSHVPWQLLQSSAQRWKRAWQEKFVFLPVDKNPGKPWWMCRRLLCPYVLLLYSDEEQFECLHTCSFISQAEDKAMESLREAAECYSLDRYFQPTGMTRPPHSFVYPKNKSA